MKSIDQRAMAQLQALPGTASEHHRSWDILVITDKEAKADKRLEILQGLVLLAEEMNQSIDTKFTDIRQWKRSSKGAYTSQLTKPEAIIL